MNSLNIKDQTQEEYDKTYTLELNGKPITLEDLRKLTK